MLPAGNGPLTTSNFRIADSQSWIFESLEMTCKPATHAGFAFSDLPLISSNFPALLPSFHYGIHYKSESPMNILEWPFDGDAGPD